MPHILSIDQGTTNSKAVLVTSDGRVRATGSASVSLSLPRPGWVEQDAEQIWSSVVAAVHTCRAPEPDLEIAGITLSTQRESVVAWRKSTGKPLGPVIGWQDRRTAEWCAQLLSDESDALVRQRTGLRIDPMFSAPKMQWLLSHLTDGVRLDDVSVGTIDSWLIWRLTGGRAYAGEAGNASRTLLYDVVDLGWSDRLLDVFGIPRRALPEVLPSDAGFGRTAGVPGVPDGVPIVAVMADSHAALFGQGCTQQGMAKATYGTGSSVMTPVQTFVPGDSPVPATLAWLTDRPTYAREGNILSSGATLTWMTTVLGLRDVAELVQLAATVADSGGVSLVPAFSGLGAPYWDRDARATISGMTTSTTRSHLARAAVESVAHQVCDVIAVIDRDGPPIRLLRADGGATASDLLMQSQADLLGRPVEVSSVAEVSALGVAQLGWASLGAAGDWTAGDRSARVFDSHLEGQERSRRRDGWRREVLWSLSRSLA